MARFKLKRTDIDKALKEVKKRSRAIELNDGGGLYIKLSSKTTGAGLCYIVVNNKYKKSTIRKTILRFDTITDQLDLDEVRKLAILEKEELIKNLELEKALEEGETVDVSLRVVWQQYLDLKAPSLRKHTLSKYKVTVKQLQKLDLLDTPIKQLNFNLLKESLNSLYIEGKHATINNIISFINTLCKFAVQISIIKDLKSFKGSLMFSLKEKKTRPSVEFEELDDIFDDMLKGTIEKALAIPLLGVILTAVRIRELLDFKPTELDHKNVGGKLWRIDASRMKAKRSHFIPMVGMINDYLEYISKYKFVSYSYLQTMLTDYRKTKNKVFTFHGFRATFSKRLNAIYPNLEKFISLAIAHKFKHDNQVDEAYNRNKYEDQLRDIFTKWMDDLENNTKIKEVMKLYQITNP